MNQYTYKRFGDSYLRSDGTWAASKSDVSPALTGITTNYLPGHEMYDSRCSACFLGHSHSQELHYKNLERYCEALLRSVYRDGAL
jgi:hypothetical protein